MATTRNPQAPSWLSAQGQQTWRKLIKQLPSIQSEHLDTLALLCNAWDLYYRSKAEVDSRGINLVCQNGRLFINPACNQMVEQSKLILKISKLFGLSPDIEAREAKVTSPFEDLIDD